MATRLAGKIAVIAGASAGIGLATARCFVEEGMDHVFITRRRKDAPDVAIVDSGRKVTWVQADVAAPSDLERLYEAVKSYSPKIDVIFASAGHTQLAPFGDADERFVDLQFDVNVKGLFFSLQKGLPLMNGGGSIILTGSFANVYDIGKTSLHSATQAAVRSLARTWMNELRERRIRVNAISPGQRGTPIMESLQRGDALTRMAEDSAAALPLRRMGDPGEIARAVSFLASNEALGISGTELFVRPEPDDTVAMVRQLQTADAKATRV
jgi:NAD(P)-dependent dehydrogenase (short-subunit alcohol dehydrogenase family)